MVFTYRMLCVKRAGHISEIPAELGMLHVFSSKWHAIGQNQYPEEGSLCLELGNGKESPFLRKKD